MWMKRLLAFLTTTSFPSLKALSDLGNLVSSQKAFWRCLMRGSICNNIIFVGYCDFWKFKIVVACFSFLSQSFKWCKQTKVNFCSNSNYNLFQILQFYLLLIYLFIFFFLICHNPNGNNQVSGMLFEFILLRHFFRLQPSKLVRYVFIFCTFFALFVIILYILA